MKRKNLVRVSATMLAMVMAVAPLAGCRGNNATSAPVTAPQASSGGNATLEADMDLMDYLSTNYASSQLPEDYNQPMLNLPADYVFEFDCCEEAGMRAHEVFKVYNSPDYANVGGMDFNWNTYDNGKISVAPDGALYLSKEGSNNIDDGTWGSMSELYLVQYIDLETGEELERPVVTPFTIEHDLQAPVVTQSVDENNCYMLSWQEVPGAVEYRVYEHFMDYGYTVECVTTETSVSADEFESQKEMDEYSELIMQDFQDAGYSGDAVTLDGVEFMNYALKYDDEMENGYFLVVAVGEDGEQSGTSNLVDVRDIAMKLPYRIADSNIQVDIASVEDIPTYVDVEMADGSIQQMVIDYHGAQTYIYPDDEYKMSIKAHVANTLFDKFFITLYGMTHEDVMAESNVITERQDEILGKISSSPEPQVNISYNEDEELAEAIDAFREEISEDGVLTGDETASEESSEEESEEPSEEESEEPSEEESEEPSEEESEEPSEEESEEPTEVASEDESEPAPEVSTDDTSKPVQLMNELAGPVKANIEALGSDKVGEMIFACNDMQAWMAMCLIAQSEVIPVPMEVFPDAANLEYTAALFIEAYRQNPICGVLTEVNYSPEYQAILVKYAETPDVRFAKAKEEIDAAYAIRDEIITDGMSDYEKVLAINDYFRTNASYDYDSTATGDVDDSLLTEQFIDSHSPHGILCNNYGVCESYSEAFIMVARISGLDAVCEIGALYGGPHEWNRVKIDDSWCVLDVTNNDIDIFTNALCNVSDEQIKGILVPDNTALLNSSYYAANDDTKEYYYMNGWAVDDLSNADEILAEQLETSDCAVIRIPADVSKSELEDVLKDLVYDHEVNYANAGAKMNLLCVMK